MSMLEKMARRLAQDALERVKPGTYTSVVDGVGLYQMLDGNYQVGERLGARDDLGLVWILLVRKIVLHHPLSLRTR